MPRNENDRIYFTSTYVTNTIERIEYNKKREEECDRALRQGMQGLLDAARDRVNSKAGEKYSSIYEELNRLVKTVTGYVVREYDYGAWTAELPGRLNDEKETGTGNLKDIQTQLENALLESEGKAMKREAFRQAAESANRLAVAKSFYDLKKPILRAENLIYELEQLSKLTPAFEESLQQFAKKNKGIDFARVDLVIDENRRKAEELRKIIDSKKAELQNFSDQNEEMIALTKKNEEAAQQLKDRSQTKSDLAQQIEHLSEIRIACEDQLKAIRKHHQGIKPVQDSILRGQNQIRERTTLLAEQESRRKGLVETEAEALKKFGSLKMGLFRKVPEDYAEVGLKLENGIQKHERLKTLINDPGARRQIQEISSSNEVMGLVGEELRSYLAEKLPDPNSKARELAEILAFAAAKDRPLSYLRYFTSKEYHGQMSDIENTLDAMKKQQKEWAAKTGADKAETRLQEIQALYHCRGEIKQLDISMEQLTAQNKTDEDRLVVDVQELKQKHSEKVVSEFKSSLGEAITKLRAAGAKEEDLKQVEDTLNAVGPDSDAFDKLEAAADKMQKINWERAQSLLSQKEECELSEKELLKTIDTNRNRMAVLAQEKTKEIAEYSEKLKKVELVINGAKAISEEEDRLLQEHETFLQDMEEANLEAERCMKELDQAVQGSVLKNMCRLYGTLNDARRTGENSPHYEDMIRPLCEALGMKIPAKGEKPREMIQNVDLSGIRIEPLQLYQTLGQIRDAAEVYIREKGKPKFYSTPQKYQRLSLAKQLIDLCDGAQKQLGAAEEYKQKFADSRLKSFREKTALVNGFIAQGEGGGCGKRRHNFRLALNKVAGDLPQEANNPREEEAEVKQNPNKDLAAAGLKTY